MKMKIKTKEEMERDWKVSEGFEYHKSVVCTMEWTIEQEREKRRQRKRRRTRDHRSSCPFGGNVAVLSFDEYDNASDVTSVGLSHFGSAGEEEEEEWDGQLYVFSSTGKLQFCKPWYEGKVAPGGFGWTAGGLLVCVLEAGDSVLLFPANENGSPRIVSFPGAASSPGERCPRVLCAHVWAGGFVVVNEDLEIWEGIYLGDLLRCEVRLRSKLSPVLLGNEVPGIITILRPFVSRDEPEMATIAIGNPSMAGMICVESDGSIRTQFAISSNVAKSLFLVPHPTYRLVASYGMDGVISVLPLDFCQVLFSHDCLLELKVQEMTSMYRHTPQSIHWCGLSTFALCISWNETPWSGPLKSGMLVLSMEHKFDILSRAHLKGSDGVIQDENSGHHGQQQHEHLGEDAIERSDNDEDGNDDHYYYDDDDDDGDEEEEEDDHKKHRPHRRKSLNMGNPQSGAHFSFHGATFVYPEVDGVRVIGFDRTYMIRQVPQCYRGLFNLGSTDPGAMLMDAVDMLESGDADADASMKALVESNKIGPAVEACLDAAEHATSLEDEQGHLLKVASYGKRFYHLTESGKISYKSRRKLAKRFIDTCRFCRMCLMARREGGIAITTRQLRIMTPKVLLDRLIFNSQFFLASKLCRAANVSLAHVITHWASAKIRQFDHGRQDEGKLIQEITRKVDSTYEESGVVVSYAGIAAVAASIGRTELAVKLGSKERKLSKRILLLLKVGDFEGALRVTHAEVGVEPDLIDFVISECLDNMSFDRIVHLAKENNVVYMMFSRYLKLMNLTKYKQLLLALDKKREKALVLGEESSMSLNPQERVLLMNEAAAEFRECNQRSFAQIASEHARLVEKQNELGDSVVGLSLANTVLDCIRRGLDDEAESFAREFGLKERIYRKVQLRGLAARKAWGRIQDLSYQQAVRSVLDDTDFAEACLAGGEMEEASRYVHQLGDDNERKVGFLIHLGAYSEALESAYQIGNIPALEIIRKRNPQLTNLVKQKLELLEANGPPIKPKQKDRPAIFKVASDRAAAAGCAQQ